MSFVSRCPSYWAIFVRTHDSLPITHAHHSLSMKAVNFHQFHWNYFSLKLQSNGFPHTFRVSPLAFYYFLRGRGFRSARTQLRGNIDTHTHTHTHSSIAPARLSRAHTHTPAWEIGASARSICVCVCVCACERENSGNILRYFVHTQDNIQTANCLPLFVYTRNKTQHPQLHT